MTWPSPGKNVTVPFWYSGLGGTPTQGQPVAGNVTVDTITDLEWGQVETEWTLRVNCNPPPPPDGGLWFGPAFEFKAFRFRVSDSTWVGAPFASMSNRTASWDFAASSGGTGGFYVQFPVSQNGVTGVFTYSTGVNVYYLWADDVLPPGVDEANPVKFTAKPMASAKGALQTVIDGGAP